MGGTIRLLADIDSAIRTWDEYSQFKLGGVGNLSLSDLHILKLHAYGKRDDLMEPMGDIRKVLIKYGIIKEKS